MSEPGVYPCEHPVPVEQEPRHQLVIANDFVRAFAVDIASRDHTLCHHHQHVYLTYVAGDAQIVSAPRGGEPATHTYHDGDCELSPPGLVHVVENLRDTNFKPLLVELLPALAGLRRGFDPKIAAGEARIVPHFADDPASIFVLDLDSDSEVEIYGPAVVASPYEHKVEVATQTGAFTLAHYRDLFWLCPATGARLVNHADTTSRVVLIALGKRTLLH